MKGEPESFVHLTRYQAQAQKCSRGVSALTGGAGAGHGSQDLPEVSALFSSCDLKSPGRLLRSTPEPALILPCKRSSLRSSIVFLRTQNQSEEEDRLHVRLTFDLAPPRVRA